MNKLRFAWFVSLIATFGSLFFSEVKLYVPCELCWYQRIMMYPLVMVLGAGLFWGNTDIKKYIIPLPIVGFVVSFYHYLTQKTSWFESAGVCSGVACSIEYINWAGFITIPFLAMIAFLLITISLLAIRDEKTP